MLQINILTLFMMYADLLRINLLGGFNQHFPSFNADFDCIKEDLVLPQDSSPIREQVLIRRAHLEYS